MPRRNGPVVTIVGSPAEVCRLQCAALASEAGVKVIHDADEFDGGDTLLLLDDASRAARIAPFAEQIGGLILTGGETARHALQAMGVRALRMVKEIEPGVPLSATMRDRPIPVITKAGAFGDAGTLVRCRAALRDL